MTAQPDVEELLLDEVRCNLDSFDRDAAWTLGLDIREKLIEAAAPAAVEVTHCGVVVLYSSLSGAGTDNQDWIRRKRNVVTRFGHSSLWMKVSAGHGFHDRYRLPLADFAAVGGSFPITVAGTGPVGIVSISGMTSDVEEHRLITASIHRLQDSSRSLRRALKAGHPS